MRWRGGRRSNNVEDLRGQGGGGRGGLGGGLGDMLRRGNMGGGGRRRMGRGKKGGMGLLGIVVVVGITLLMGGDLGSILGNVMGGGGQSYAPGPSMSPQRSGGQTGVQQTGRADQDELANFTATVLAFTEDAWHDIFRAEGMQYREPKLVLFEGAVQSACGTGQSAMGPFYCPGDQKVYIDLSFYRDLRQRFNAPGDFAQAYVIAHEVGHHVQTLLGVSEKVQQAKRRASREQANAIQVKMELQADCLAGVWANHANRTKKILEAGDVAEAMAAAKAIGDDTIQRQSTGRVRPETFTHGTAAQRQRWFNAGLKSGRMGSCDTFSARQL